MINRAKLVAIVRLKKKYFCCRNETQSGALEILPSIGIVVNQLKASVEYFNRVKQSYDGLVQQRNSLPTLCLDSKSTVDLEF